MKSSPEDHKIIRTSCKNCAFAKYENDTQIDCLHNRIAKFKKLPDNNEEFQLVVEAYDGEKEFFVINRFCNLYRDKSKVNAENSDLEKSRDEIKLTFDVLIDCSKIDDNEYLTYVKEVISNLSSYGSKKTNLHLYHKQSLTKEYRKIVLSLNQMFMKSTLSVYFDRDVLIHNILSKSTNSYNLIIDYKHRGNVNIFSILDHMVNDELKKILVCKNVNTYVVSNLSYKIETMGKIKIDLQNSINNIIEYAKADYYVEV